MEILGIIIVSFLLIGVMGEIIEWKTDTCFSNKCFNNKSVKCTQTPHTKEEIEKYCKPNETEK